MKLTGFRFSQRLGVDAVFVLGAEYGFHWLPVFFRSQDEVAGPAKTGLTPDHFGEIGEDL